MSCGTVKCQVAEKWIFQLSKVKLSSDIKNSGNKNLKFFVYFEGRLVFKTLHLSRTLKYHFELFLAAKSNIQKILH